MIGVETSCKLIMIAKDCIKLVIANVDRFYSKYELLYAIAWTVSSNDVCNKLQNSG